MDEIVNKGKGSQPKTSRNEALVEDYKAGMSMVDLIKKYNVTHTRIYAIVNSYGVPRRNKRRVKKDNKGGGE